MAIDRYKPRVEIRINGIARTLLGGGDTAGTRAAFPTGTYLLDPAEGKPNPGDKVQVRAGFGALYPTFTGEIDQNGIRLAPNEIEIACTGTLARLNATAGVPPAIDDGNSEPEYVAEFESATASEIIGALLTMMGVLEFSLEDSGKVFATLDPIGLTANDNPWALVQQLDEAEGYRTIQGRDGVVRRLPLIGIPGTVYKTFAEGVDLYAGTLSESRLGTFNRVIATGLPQQGTTGIDFVPTGIMQAPSPWIPTPPTYRAYSYNSYLFETGDDCEEYAARKLGELNRLRGELPFDLVVGDTTLQPGMSIAIDALRLDVRANVRFWIIEITHNYDQGINTSGVLLLASEGIGWSPNLAPIPVITYRAMRETLGDGTEILEAIFDGSASYDPELGIAGIVSYAWDGDPAAPTPFDEGRFASLQFAGDIPEDATVTLTVTDDLGKTGSLTIPLTDVAAVATVRDLISAEGTRLQVSRDGQRSWQSVLASGSPIAAVGTCEFAAAEYTFAWDGAGVLYKVLADNTATVVAGVEDVTACGITLLNADTNAPSARVWAGASDGRVWLSTDHGATWVAKAPAPNGGQVNYIGESAFRFGDIEMAAGGTSYRSFDEAVGWTAQYAHPNANLTARRIASGFGKGWIGFSGPGPTEDDDGASRLRERDDAISLDFPSGDKPASVVGLTLDVAADLLYALDIDDGGAGRAWRGNSAIGGEMEEQPYDDATYGEPRHMIRDGTMPGLLYIAAENKLLKSNDGLATIQVMKSLSGGATGRMIGYGAERALVRVALTVISTVGEEQALTLWNGSGNDDPPAFWYAVNFDDSGWGASEAGSVNPGGVTPIEDAVWSGDAVNAGGDALFRRTFSVPAGPVSAATLTVEADNYAKDIFVNGQRCGGNLEDVEIKVLDVRDLIRPGHDNVIAIRVGEADGPLYTWIAYRLEVS